MPLFVGNIVHSASRPEKQTGSKTRLRTSVATTKFPLPRHSLIYTPSDRNLTMNERYSHLETISDGGEARDSPHQKYEDKSVRSSRITQAAGDERKDELIFGLFFSVPLKSHCPPRKLASRFIFFWKRNSTISCPCHFEESGVRGRTHFLLCARKM